MSNLDSGRGVRKVSEKITEEGRTLIITETDSTKLNWGQVPDGTLQVDPVTGAMAVKVKGESDWMPISVGIDGILKIGKDSVIKYEVFRIINRDNGNGTFSYKNANGDIRTNYLDSGWMIFDLEEGTYMTNYNRLEVIIDDKIHLSAKSGGLTEIDPERFKIYSQPNNTEVTVQYFQKIDTGAFQIVEDMVKEAVKAHEDRRDNPHQITKSDIGLGNVLNVKQAAKADFDSHLTNEMPHLLKDVTAGKIYKWGMQMQGGIPQMIYEEV